MLTSILFCNFVKCTVLYYIKTCIKRPLKIDKTLMENGSLMEVKVLQNAPLGAFCNTFNLH